MRCECICQCLGYGDFGDMAVTAHDPTALGLGVSDRVNEDEDARQSSTSYSYCRNRQAGGVKSTQLHCLDGPITPTVVLGCCVQFLLIFFSLGVTAEIR